MAEQWGPKESIHLMAEHGTIDEVAAYTAAKVGTWLVEDCGVPTIPHALCSSFRSSSEERRASIPMALG